MVSIRNTVILALMQVGVIVAGVLAAGVCHKVWSSNGMMMPRLAGMLYDYGVLFFSVPFVWSSFTLMLLLRRPEISNELKKLAFWFGVLLLLVLIVFMWVADITPWFGFGGGPVRD